MFLEQNTNSRTYSSFSPEFLGRFEIVPFGPIPRGEDGFQKIIKQNMESALNTLKTRNRLSGFSIENEEEVLTILEESLYGNGIGIRRIQQYFEVKLNTVIHTRILTEIDPKGTKFVLFPFDRNTIGVRVDAFVLGEDVTIFGGFRIYH